MCKKNLLPFFSLLLISSKILSQTFNLSGRVLDTDEKPIQFASIFYYSKSDTTKMIDGTITDLEGNYIFKKIVTGSYIIKSSFVGYETQKSFINCDKSDTSITNDFILPVSISTISEVVVQRKLTQHNADKDVFIISTMNKKNSSSAFDVLKIVPNVNIDVVNKKIATIHNESVKILINGMNADETDLLTLKSDDIVKVEYYNVPSARYASYNVAAVINVITKQGIRGGEVIANIQNAFTTGFGDDEIKLKYNKKNFQISFKYNLSYRNYKDRRASTSYNLFSVNNLETNKFKQGTPSPFSYEIHDFNFDFINQKIDNYVFNINVIANISNNSSINKQTIFLNNQYNGTGKFNITSTDIKPSFDIYFSKKIKKNQEFVFNIVPTYFDSKYLYDNNEESITQGIFNQFSNTKGKKYSLIGEVVYSIDLNFISLRSGMKYQLAKSQQNIADSRNSENLSSILSETYTFTELSGKHKSISYSLGLGISNSIFDSKELNKKYNFNTIRPSLTLNYEINKSNNLRFSSRLDPYEPGLSELSNSSIYFDSLLIYRGNPNLKPFSYNKNELSFTFSSPKYSFTAGLDYYYAWNPILTSYTREGDSFVQSSSNQKKEIQYTFSLDLQCSPFEQKWIRYITVSIFMLPRPFRSRRPLTYSGIGPHYGT